MSRDPSIFLNQFLSLRLHPQTKNAIEVTLKKNWPKTDDFYYGVILAEKAVVSLIKNDPSISIAPAGKITLILRLFKRYRHHIQLHHC